MLDDMEPPRWATWARNVFQALVILYGVTWLIRGALELSNLVLDTRFFRDDSSSWPGVVFAVGVGLGAVSGLAWLAGEVVAGYREPRARERRGGSDDTGHVTEK